MDAQLQVALAALDATLSTVALPWGMRITVTSMFARELRAQYRGDWDADDEEEEDED